MPSDGQALLALRAAPIFGVVDVDFLHQVHPLSLFVSLGSGQPFQPEVGRELETSRFLRLPIHSERVPREYFVWYACY